MVDIEIRVVTTEKKLFFSEKKLSALVFLFEKATLEGKGSILDVFEIQVWI